MCLRCLLNEHLVDQNIDNLNSFIMQSLCFLSFNSGLDPQTLVSTVPNQDCSENNKEKSKTKLLDAFQMPHQATKRFLQSNSSLPQINGLNQSGQLLFLHARSFLTERTSSEILDFTLSSFRHFDRFCPTCLEKLCTLKTTTTSELRVNTMGFRKRNSLIKFRLFNIEPNHQGLYHQQMASSTGSEVAFDVAANFKNGSITDVSSMTSSSMLHENIGSTLFDNDAFGSMEPFSLGLGEDFESNLIEPLFQLLIEVFELKGTMIRTFRRTLMLGFRLVFGQTMFSKQIKMSLKHLFTDSNILHMIAILHSTVHSWNEELARNTSGAEGVKTATTLESNPNVPIHTSSTVTEPESIDILNKSSTPDYFYDLNELFDTFPTLKDTSPMTSTTNLTPESGTRPGSAASHSEYLPIPGFVITPPADIITEQTDIPKDDAQPTDNHQNTAQQQTTDEQAANIARLQILAKQLLFASVPTFLNHLFGAENTITGLNKSFDILQYQELNKQLIYVSLFANMFLLLIYF